MNDQPPNPVGRPTKYDPKYCEMLVEHMKSGFSFESFGAIADCSKDTLFEWVKVYPDFSDSYKRAQEHCRHHWEELGHDMVLAGQGNSATWIFNMKNRFKWTDRQDITTDGKELPVPLLGNVISTNDSNRETPPTE